MSASLATSVARGFDELIIHSDAKDSEVAQRLSSLIGKEKTCYVDEKPLPSRPNHLTAEEFSASKKRIYIEPHRGQFFKRCPGAKPGLVCCNYFVLNLGLQCNMNCSYCYLQSYLNTPNLTIYSNIEQALEELAVLAEGHSDKRYRVGTGETIDSLSLDPLTLYSRKLIAFFRKYPQWTVEFKTKSSFVDQFLDIEHSGNTLVSWSLNPQHIITKEEHGTASLDERLTAARKCIDKGFKVTFHFDPMIYHHEWKKNYGELVQEITQKFKPHEIDILSVGALRFVPEQRQMMKERFGLESYVTTAEVFKSQTGKLRYDQAIRREMFEFMLTEFKKNSSDWRISLCMESPESWAMTMPDSPRKMSEIEEIFSPLPKSIKKERPTLRPTVDNIGSSQI